MSQFQPLTGPGYRVNKKAATVEQLRAEIQRRLSDLNINATVPPIVPADRGRNSANWQVDSWVGVPSAVQEIIVVVMREIEIEEPN
jgi:hypothetical protein